MHTLDAAHGVYGFPVKVDSHSEITRKRRTYLLTAATGVRAPVMDPKTLVLNFILLELLLEL